MGTTITDERKAFYLHALTDLTEPRIQYAFETALTRCKFFPTIAELFEFAYEWKPAEPLPDYVQNNLGKNPIAELERKMRSNGAITDEDMNRWREDGQRKHEQILVNIAKSGMVRDLAGNPGIERQINALRLTLGHPLTVPAEEFETQMRQARKPKQPVNALPV